MQDNPWKPGKYIVTGIKGAQSTKNKSMNSENVNLYPKDTVFEIIDVYPISIENRIRGQIKDSLDWVSMKNTSNGYLWMKPVTNQYEHIFIDKPFGFTVIPDENNRNAIVSQVFKKEIEIVLNSRIVWINQRYVQDEIHADIITLLKKAEGDIKIIFELANYKSKINELFKRLDADNTGTIGIVELKIIYPDSAQTLLSRFDVDGGGDLGIEEFKKLIGTEKMATEILNKLEKKNNSKYEKNIQEILNILDTNKSGTINLQELQTLYPDAAYSLFSRFDLDHNGELDVQELKGFINSVELATEVLNRLQAQEFEKNVIEIFNFLHVDLSATINLKELKSLFPNAADYLFTRFDLKNIDELSVEDFTMYINSYASSKEFLIALKGRLLEQMKPQTKGFKKFHKKEYEKNINEIFRILDADSSGRITINELASYPEITNTFFTRVDLNNSSGLSIGELKNIIHSYQLSSELLEELKKKKSSNYVGVSKYNKSSEKSWQAKLNSNKASSREKDAALGYHGTHKRSASANNQSAAMDDLNSPKINCPGCHGLKSFTTPIMNFSCNDCGKNMDAGKLMYGCRRCDFDLCHSCWKQSSIGDIEQNTTGINSFKDGDDVIDQYNFDAYSKGRSGEIAKQNDSKATKPPKNISVKMSQRGPAKNTTTTLQEGNTQNTTTGSNSDMFRYPMQQGTTQTTTTGSNLDMFRYPMQEDDAEIQIMVSKVNVSLRNYIKNMEKMLNERNQELSRYMIWKTKHAAMKEILQSKIQELEKCQNELVLSQTEFDNQFKHFEQQNEETMNKTSANFEYNVSNFQNLLTNCRNENTKLKEILKDNVNIIADANARNRQLNDEVKNLNNNELNFSGRHESLIASEANSNLKLENLTKIYEELRSNHVEMVQSQSFKGGNETKLQKEVRQNDFDLKAIKDEIEWITNKHDYVVKENQELKNENAELKQHASDETEELLVLKFKNDMSDKKYKDEVNEHLRTKDDLSHLKEKYYLLFDQHGRALYKHKEFKKQLGNQGEGGNQVEGTEENGENGFFIDPNEHHDLKVKHNQLKALTKVLKDQKAHEISTLKLAKKDHDVNIQKIEKLKAMIVKLKLENQEMHEKYGLQMVNLNTRLEKFKKDNVMFKSQISNLENGKYNNENLINEMKNTIQENDIEILSLKAQLKRINGEIDSLERTVQRLEKQYQGMNGKYKDARQNLLALKTSHHSMDFEAQHNKMSFGKQGRKLETLEEVCKKQANELKRLQKHFDDLNSNYRVSCKKFDEEFQMYHKLCQKHENIQENLDKQISDNTKQKYELQNMKKINEKLQLTLVKKSASIKDMEDQRGQGISNTKEKENQLKQLFENSYADKIKKLKSIIRNLKIANKHLLLNPQNISNGQEEKNQVESSNLIITYKKKIKYLTKELERMETEKLEFLKLEILNNNIITMNNKNDQFEETLAKLSKTLAEKEIELMKSELQSVAFKTRIFHLQDTIIDLQENDTLRN